MFKKFKVYILFLSIVLVLSGCNLLSADNTKDTPSESPASEFTKSPEVSAPQPAPADTSKTEETVIPTSAPAKNPSSETREERAEEILKDMTLKEKAGQMFFVRCIKNQAPADIKKYRPGGYILFGDDFKDDTEDTIRATISGYQKNTEIPMLIGVDEEGGNVNRISKYPAFRFAPFKSPQDLYKEGGMELILSDTKEKADLLKSLGINVNLAPVCDVSTDAQDFIYSRSFGKEAGETAEYVKAVVTKMNEEGIGSTLKHFPGYGNNADTHTGIATDERSYETFEKSDFLPFQAGIAAGAGSVMVSHNIVKCMDEDYPASLSAKVHTILRENLGFKGVIMTDDLSMDAIKQYTGDEEAAVQAILAGNDLVVATDYEVQIPAVLSAVQAGTITEDRIDESVIRILIWKLNLGIIK